MSDEYSEALKEAYATAKSNVAILETIEISHPSFEEVIRLVNNPVDIVATLEGGGAPVTFKACAFDLKLPKKTDEGIQELQLKVCNVDRRISDFMSDCSSHHQKVTCKFRPYLSNDLSGPSMPAPLLLTLTDISATIYEVNARASFADLINKRFPGENYSRTLFKSLGGG